MVAHVRRLCSLGSFCFSGFEMRGGEEQAEGCYGGARSMLLRRGLSRLGLGVTVRWHQGYLHDQVHSQVVKGHRSEEILIATQEISELG